MELLEAIRARKSIRAYKADPVPHDLLIRILEAATRAPSGVNSQPWEFFVVSGAALSRLKEANLESYRRGVEPHPEVPVGDIKGVAPSLKGVYRDRQVELAVQIFKLLGIGKDDKAGQEAYNEQMVQFYDAPAVIILVADKVLGGSWPIMDMGFVSQNITLSALEAGLGTCVMRAIVDYPERVREVVGIPESKRIIVGIAIGYPDWDHPINALETRRENIEKLVVRVE